MYINVNSTNICSFQHLNEYTTLSLCTSRVYIPGLLTNFDVFIHGWREMVVSRGHIVLALNYQSIFIYLRVV
ncbi:hypothetical protein EB796_003587 [Bugula neritina]|uniref:Uncharacterized protein n=1 Tax=Bugula neritina TaxID=10212 RepID=A0A7J7KJK9_BUGNE|nr:hypothetical protein EB796_003587 [Bugula neritina]